MLTGAGRSNTPRRYRILGGELQSIKYDNLFYLSFSYNFSFAVY